MSYQDRWQTAQFRDLEFLTDSHDAKGGRRLAVHEFPGAEWPVVEDLGGQANGWTLNAYFIGANYDTACDALIAELIKPGAEWLIHPWLGRLWVRARSWSRRETHQEQGFCTLAIEFVPGGEPPPVAEPDKVDAAAAAIEGFADAAEADFDLLAMSADGLNAFVSTVQGGLEMVRQAISFAALPLSWAQQALNLVSGFKGDVGSLAATPDRYAATLRSLTHAVGLGDIQGNTSADAGGISLSASDRPRWVSRLTALSSRPVYVVTGVAATDSAVRGNLAREQALQSRLFLATAMQATLVDFAAEADRDAALQSIDAAYDALLPALPDAVFQAAISARAALMDAVMAQDLKPQQIRDIVSPLPSTVLAHRMQIDEAVLIARNGVRHPLFVRGRVYG
ncbi:DNA circularization N-terminal domain-containing protein [Methylomonas rapida]|uniref:DNA circularization N-terminal domain-containing protein n=1 Tax=Methylomonas rapida TaxID=2963939 RepID=A0ABY7GLU3_9GAMM|nr:DNA circularization N-terminal domain-containing protein [Methylomonas rapida]WAR45467.1 DNA circularization N-terminal domain-containing protein [Methylomonas rapida]